MASVEPAFTENLRRILAPPLKDAGFTFDGRRVLRRSIRERTQIVGVQVGERWMQGKFTMNLAVYDPGVDSPDVERATVQEFHCGPTRRQRLGMLLPRRFAALGRFPFLGILCGPKDKWWSACDAEGMDEAKNAFFKYGVTWLEQHTR
jgi:hypothetical protein